MNCDYFPAIRQLVEYEVWCNARTFEAVRELSEAELFQAFPFGFNTVHATLFHTVEVLQTWSGCVGTVINKPAMVPYDPRMPLDELARWNTEISASFLKALDEAHAAELLHRDRRIVQVFHLITHGTHHRTQCMTMLRLLGKELPYESGDFGGWTRTGG